MMAQIINVTPDSCNPGCTRVECYNSEYKTYEQLACFYGTGHHVRASEYANFLNGKRNRRTPEQFLSDSLDEGLIAVRSERFFAEKMPLIAGDEE